MAPRGSRILRRRFWWAAIEGRLPRIQRLRFRGYPKEPFRSVEVAKAGRGTVNRHGDEIKAREVPRRTSSRWSTAGSPRSAVEREHRRGGVAAHGGTPRGRRRIDILTYTSSILECPGLGASPVRSERLSWLPRRRCEPWGRCTGLGAHSATRRFCNADIL